RRFKRKRIRICFFHIAKLFGLFALARYLTRKALRILCYHGTAMVDEHEFRPGLWMRPMIFRERMRRLVALKYPVIDLESALDGLRAGTLPPCATVLTVDDGSRSTFDCQLPEIKDHSFPVTVYVTTYYSLKRTPVFRLIVQYMFWKTKQKELNCSGLG